LNVTQAVLTAIGIDWDGRRPVVAVELANRESRSTGETSCSEWSGKIRKAHRLDRGEYRRDPDLLPTAAPAS
jgi:hypothetical protein